MDLFLWDSAADLGIPKILLRKQDSQGLQCRLEEGYITIGRQFLGAELCYKILALTY